jgi:UDP-3-O-[3-hydroxymyristoyl] glucosamine N-acyltransferase
VRIHPSARLTGPCWIGSRSEVGADAAIGPNAIIGTHSVIDANSSVADSVVLPDTFVGARVHLQRMMADGNVLLDATRGTRVEITDSFMLGRLHQGWGRWFKRRGGHE